MRRIFWIATSLVVNVRCFQPQQQTNHCSLETPPQHPLQDPPSPPTRRSLLSTLLVSVASSPLVARAATTSKPDRADLLSAIANNAPDDTVIELITQLSNPPTTRLDLDGQWELLWSYKAEAFSPLLKLPPPFRPTSYQYFGATEEVGEGRIAQGLTGGIVGRQRQLWLSSGAIALPQDPSILEIQPPFRLELGGPYGAGTPKRMLVEAGSDADFRQVNGRTLEAQQAGKNQYQQLYVEGNSPGSLRVSSVIAGDPVLVGEIFVHRKL